MKNCQVCVTFFLLYSASVTGNLHLSDTENHFLYGKGPPEGTGQVDEGQLANDRWYTVADKPSPPRNDEKQAAHFVEDQGPVAKRRTIPLVTDFLKGLEPEPFISPEGLLPAQISAKELAAIDLFLYTMTQLAQLAVIVGLLLPLLHLQTLPMLLFAIANVVNLFRVITGFF